MVRNAALDASFAELSDAEGLSAEHENRLALILDRYLVAIEQGTPVTPTELLERHPEDAVHLRRYLSGLELFHAAARPGGDVARERSPLLTSTSLPSGASIGEFQLVREIGRGGMGVVYEAVQPSLRRRVALKVLPAAAARDAKHIGRFKNEAQAAAQVQHPNIVPVYAVGEVCGMHYFAMQLIEGMSLAEWIASTSAPGDSGSAGTTGRNDTRTRIASSRRFAAERAALPGAPGAAAIDSRRDISARADSIARLGIQAAEALHAAHEFGVVHRDVKPSNLLLDSQGKLWVADFGLARIREGASLTQTGDICGTMRYMSPEQARGQTATVDHRTDIYSLGVTLYELATGRHPADDGSGIHHWLDRNDASIKSPRSWDSRIPVDFDTIVMKAMSHEPGDRYATAKALSEDLGRFLQGEPILACPPSRMQRVTRFAARHKRSVAAVGFAVVAGLVSAAYIAGARNWVESARIRETQSYQFSAEMVYDLPMSTAEQLEAIPGTEGVRRQLLEESLRYYKRLAAQTYADPSLGVDLAVAYSRIASLTSEMGNDAQALQAHQDAKQLLERLLDTDPGNRDHAMTLATCQNNYALSLVHVGRSADAVVELQAARALLAPLTSQGVAEVAALVELARTYDSLGIVARDAGRPKDAARWFAAAIEAGERAREAAPTRNDVARKLATSYNFLGDVSEATDASEATRAHELAIALLQDLVRRQPLNQVFEAELAQSYSKLGNACCAASDWASAQRSYSAAMTLGRDLVKRSPLAASHWRTLAATCNNLGMALSHVGRLEEAAQAFDEAMTFEMRLLKSRSGEAAALSNLGATANNLGMLLERQRRNVEAEREYRRAISYQSRALEKEPGSSRYRELLSKHYAHCARNLRERGLNAESLAATLDRHALWNDNAAEILAVARELAELHAASKESTDTLKTRIVHAGVRAIQDAKAAGAAVENLREPLLAEFLGALGSDGTPRS